MTKQLDETALLNRYLKSRGINPGFVSKDQKVAHSKTTQFKVWAQAHVNDDVRESITTEPSPSQKRLSIIKSSINKHKEIRTTNGKQLHSEAVDKKDTITFDIPLLIRVLEFAREDLQSDVHLHRMVERLLKIRGRGVLSMNEYGVIVKEDVDSLSVEEQGTINECVYMLSEISVELQHSYFKKAHAQKYDKTGTTPKTTKQKRSKGMDKVVSRTLKRNVIGLPKGVDPSEGGKYTADSVEVEGTPIQEGSAALRFAQALKRERETRELKDKTREAREKLQPNKPTEPVKENMEPMAACSQPGDGANTPDDTVPVKRSSKLKMILGGKKTVKEEMYDHEKEDKSTAPVGKKVKLQKPGTDAVTKEAPQAAAVLSGGKTMTGEPRDTIEIDPMMKMRKQSPNSQKSV